KAYAVAARGSKTSPLSRTYAVIAAAALVAAAACSTAGGVQGRRVVLAYTKNADTTRQSVWVADRNGRHGRRLARGRAPVVSPDGSQVAFAGGCTGDPPADCTKLYVVSTGGGSPRLLGRAEGPARTRDRRSGNPVWGPRRIAFTKFRRRGGYPAYDLWTTAADGRGARLVVRGKTVANRFNLNELLGLFPVEWGSDGRRLLTTYMTEL